MDLNVQTTVDKQNQLSEGMKAFYDKNIIKEASLGLIHDQFGQKRRIPQNGGKTIDFIKLSPLPKALKPLEEGVTPDGNSLVWSKKTATVKQYGDYVALSDTFITTDIDNSLVEAGVVLGNQAGETLDAITREVLCSGTNVQYADGAPARYVLTGGESANNDYLTVDCVKRAVRTLKRNKAKKINGYYVGIIHPDVAYDLMDDPKWENVKTYSSPADMYKGEIGRLYGVRFVETQEAKIFSADPLKVGSTNLTVNSVSGKVITIKEALSADEALALAGRKIIIADTLYEIASATSGAAGSAKITVTETPAAGVIANALIYAGEAGAKGRDVYATLILGSDAYGVTEIEGGGLTNIVKQLGSGGTSDPLDQRATTGWKAYKAAEILVDEYMVRIETASSY